MAIKVRCSDRLPVLQWFAKDASEIIPNMLIKSNSGADPVAAAHTGQTILGVTLETQATANGLVKFYPVTGKVLEIDFLVTGTKTTFSTTDLGSQFDIVVTSGNQVLDPDDTSGGFLILVGYDNSKHKAYVVLDSADLLLSC